MGIDLGTTTSKVMVMTFEGRELAVARRATPWTIVPSGAELAPEGLLPVVLGCVREVLERIGGGCVRALGITAIGQSGVLIGRESAPLTPIVVWHDTRARDQAEGLAAAIGTREFAGMTGLAPSPYFAPSMYRWHFDNGVRPGDGARWLGMAEWLAFALGGAQVAEWSLASQSGFLDTFRGTWAEPILDWAGVKHSLFPDLVAAGTTIGVVDPSFPLLEGAAIAIAGHDHPCAAVGAFATAQGDVYDSCGTAETIVEGTCPIASAAGVIDAILEDGLMFGRHVVAGQMTVTGSIPTGRFLGGVLDALGVDPAASADLDRRALDLPPQEPLPNIQVRNGLPVDFGAIAAVGEPAVAWRRAVETAASEGAKVSAAIARHAGPAGHVIIGGGWTRNPAFLTAKTARVPSLIVAPSDEPGARGAAILAGRAIGVVSNSGSDRGGRTP